MKIQIEVKCPYCKFINQIYVEIGNQRFVRELINCDLKDEGCDKDFVIDVAIKTKIETFKVEGE